MEVVNKFDRALQRYREGGWHLIAHLLSNNGYTPRWLWYLYELELLKLRELNARAISRRLAGFEYRIATQLDVPELARVPKPKSVLSVEREFEGYLAEGHQCFVVTERERIVGYNWAFRGQYRLALENDQNRMLTIGLGDDTVFFGIGFIQPEYRLKGLFPHLVNAVMSAFGSETEFFTAVHTINERSLRSHQRLGFETFCTAVCTRALGSPYRWIFRFPDGDKRSLGWGTASVQLSALLSEPAQRFSARLPG